MSTSRATVANLAMISRRAILASGAMLALGACRRPPRGAARGERVVVLSPALAATLKDLGVSDLVVGRHGWDMALDPALPVCGDQSGIDYEALLAARPTVVIIELNPRDVPERLVKLAQSHGWELVNLPALSLDDVVRVTGTLEDRFAPGAGLADRLAELSGGAGGLERAGRVMLIAGEQPIAALGPGSVHHDLLVRLGGVPAVSGGGPYQELDAEDMVTLAPECAVVLLPRSPGSAPGPAVTGTEIAARPGLALLRNSPAAERGRLAIIDDPLCLTPSTSLLRVAKEMEEILRRWAE